jgi:hypothetical protein
MAKIDFGLDAPLNEKELYENPTTSTVLDSGLYQGLLKYIYFTTVGANKTKVANAVVEINGISRTFSMFYCYSATGKPTRITNGKKEVMPGFKQLNSLAYCACGKPITECDQEDKTIMVHDWKENKDKPELVKAVIDVMDTKIGVAIKKVNKHKTVKVNGQSVPTTETFHTNEIYCWLTADGFTASEKATGGEPNTAKRFKEKHTGEIFEEKLKVTPIAPPTAATAAVAKKPADDLFADDDESDL